MIRNKRNCYRGLGSAKSLLKSLATLLIITLSFTSVYAQEDAAKGKDLFDANCASCHAMDKVAIGPALRNVRQRYEDEWLVQWIQNNVALRKSGDERAIAIYDKYNQAAMNVFGNLSEDDIKNILAYTDTEPEPDPEPTVAGGGGDTFFNNYTKYLLLIVALILLIVFVILLKIFRELKTLRRKQQATEEGVTYHEAA